METFFCVTTFQALEGCDHISLKSSLLKAKHIQFFQSLLTGLCFQSPDHPRYPPLDQFDCFGLASSQPPSTSRCKSLLRNALQTHCGHRYCSECLAWIVRNSNNPVCQRCKEEDPGTTNEESLLSAGKAFSDAAINKEILELSVRCGIPGCNWMGFMKNLDDHQSTCEYAPVPCHANPCGQAAMRKRLADRLQGDCADATPCSDGGSPKVSGNEHQKPLEHMLKTCPAQNSLVVFAGEEGCRFSRIGCSFKGNAEDRKEHERQAAGTHLMLLLHHVMKLKARLYPGGGALDARLTDSTVLMEIFLSLKLWGALAADSSRLPLCEEESRRTLPRTAKGVSLLEGKLSVFENIASVLSKEMAASRQKIVAFRSQRGLDQDMIRGLELKITDLQRCLIQKDTALSKLEERLLLSEQASYDGVFLWKIMDVHRKCYEAVCGKLWGFHSPPFYTSRYGYKLCMKIYLNGEGQVRGTHLSLFVVLLKGKYDALLQWPFAHKVTLMLLDQNDGEHLVNTLHPDPASASFQKPVTDMNEASGFPRFVPLAKLHSPKHAYFREGTLFLKCVTEATL
ncbi:TNF receptor-associated factor 1 [Rhineura floridana]|uniref:TNF receptor-associated factor 1 n=1 Tax=Rhineura floridana TaxID=261503 RepID=UPI002AC875D8|nr:TNF receptor-associated factor 1 [Rhineura floridana]